MPRQERKLKVIISGDCFEKDIQILTKMNENTSSSRLAYEVDRSAQHRGEDRSAQHGGEVELAQHRGEDRSEQHVESNSSGNNEYLIEMWMGFGPDDNDVNPEAMVNLFPVETVETMAGMYDDVMEARDWLRMTLGRMCDAHHETANELQYIINALTARNEELTARNEELTAENEELTAENEEMREEGRKLVDELAIKTEQLDEEIFWREENGRELGYDYHSPYWEGAYWDGLPCSHFEEQGNDGDDNGGEDDEEYKHDEEYGDSGNSVTMMMKIVVDIMLRALWRKSSELLRLMCESFLNKLEKDERQVSFIEE